MKYPYWEKRGWAYQKTSYSLKNTTLVKKSNNKRGYLTKEIKLKVRPSGSKYNARALLVKKKDLKTTNLQQFKKQLANAKKSRGHGFLSKKYITNDPTVISYMKKNHISCNKLGKNKYGRNVSFEPKKEKVVKTGKDTRPKFDFRFRKYR